MGCRVSFVHASGCVEWEGRRAAGLSLDRCEEGRCTSRAPAGGYLGGGSGNALPDPISGYKPPTVGGDEVASI